MKVYDHKFHYFLQLQHVNSRRLRFQWNGVASSWALAILRLRQNGRHFADNIIKCIFFNENCCILIKISLKYIPRGPFSNKPALVQIMAWRRWGDKALSEPMMALFTDAYMHHSAPMSYRKPWPDTCDLMLHVVIMPGNSIFYYKKSSRWMSHWHFWQKY